MAHLNIIPEFDGSSNNPCSDTFAGPAAHSEPEIAAYTRFYQTIASSVKVYFSFHAYGQYIMTPFGHTSVLPENHFDLMSIALKGKDAIEKLNGRDYIVGPIAEVMCK